MFIFHLKRSLFIRYTEIPAKIDPIEHCFYRVMYIGQSSAENDVLLTGYRQDLPRSGKLPVLLRSRKSAFLPRRGDLLHRFVSNSERGTWGSLPMRNFTPIGARAWVRSPKSRKFPLLVKNRPQERQGRSQPRRSGGHQHLAGGHGVVANKCLPSCRAGPEVATAGFFFCII